jgi:hypothetical protein
MGACISAICDGVWRTTTYGYVLLVLKQGRTVPIRSLREHSTYREAYLDGFKLSTQHTQPLTLTLFSSSRAQINEMETFLLQEDKKYE